MPGLCSMCGPRTSRRSCRLLLGDAVNLVSRRAQARDAVAVEVTFPGDKLIDRDVVQHARLIDWHPPAAHGFDDGGLALHGPALVGARQLRNIGPITSACRIDLHFSPYRRNSQTATTAKPIRKITPATKASASGVMPCMPTR